MPKKFAKTKPTEREWNHQAGGWETVAKCPEDGGMVVYNGNYFCENWGDCNWALPGDPPITRPTEVAICYQLGIDPKTGELFREGDNPSVRSAG